MNRLLRHDIIYGSILGILIQSLFLSAAKKPSEESKLLAGCCLNQAGPQSEGDQPSLRPKSKEIKEQRWLKKTG